MFACATGKEMQGDSLVQDSISMAEAKAQAQQQQSSCMQACSPPALASGSGSATHVGSP